MQIKYKKKEWLTFSKVLLFCLSIVGTVIVKKKKKRYDILASVSALLTFSLQFPTWTLTTFQTEAGGVFQPIESLWRTKDSWEQRRQWEPEVLLSHRIHFSQRSPGCVSREMAKFSQVELWSEAQMGWITVTTQEEIMHNLITHQPAVVLHFFNIPKIYSLLYICDNC